MKITPIAACLLTLATFCTAASAQDVDPGALVKAAQSTIQQIDEGRAATVWDGMSAAVKQRVPRKDFTEAITRSRQSLGTPGVRYWVTVSRQQAQGTASIPAGMYSSVEFESLARGSDVDAAAPGECEQRANHFPRRQLGGIGHRGNIRWVDG